MSIRIANIRLELGEPEEGLPEKIAARLGVGAGEIASWRILRKSLDARSHDDLHFVYAAEVQLPDEARPEAPGSSRLRTSSPTSPSDSTGPSRARARCDTGR